MTHARCRALLDDFLSENLPLSARAEMAAHLESCAACGALKSEREADLGLSRAALSGLSRRSAPPELRLRVRAAIQDERAAVEARRAGPQSWFPARAMRVSAWSGTLVFGALALLILARPFAQMPLGSAPELSPELSPVLPSDAPAAQSPAVLNRKAAPGAQSQIPISRRRQNAEQRPSPRLEGGKTGVARPQKPAFSPRIEGSKRAEVAPPPPIAIPAEPLFNSPSGSASNSRLPATSGRTAALPRLPRPQDLPRNSEAPGALQDAAAKPGGSTDGAAPKVAAVAPERRAAKVAAPNSIRRNTFRAPITLPPLAAPLPVSPSAVAPLPDLNSNGLREASDAMNQNRAASATTDFDIVISQAAPEKERQAIFGSIPATGTSPRVQQNQRAGGFSGAGGRGGFGGAGGRGGFSEVAPTIPAAPTAPQIAAPQRPTTPALQAAPGSAFNVVPDGAQNDALRNRASALENRVGAAAVQSWTITLLSPRAVEGAVVRVILPPSLRADDPSATDTVFRGDLVPGRAVILRFSTRSARGGENISVIVEQNGAAAQSKPVTTRIFALPTPKS